MKLSIIVPARNEAGFLRASLSALRWAQGRDIEVIVVDVRSTDQSRAVAEQEGARVISIEPSPPGKSRNAGVAASGAPLLAFVDADVVVAAEWRNRVLQLLASPEKVPDRVIGAPYAVREDATSLEVRWFGGIASDFVTYVPGGNLICSKRLFETLGGFSECLETGEDVDFCQRAREAGFRIEIDPGLRAVHLGYPRTIRSFFIREVWHGSGDVRSLRAVLRSKTAIVSLAFGLTVLCAAIAMMAASLMTGMLLLAAASALLLMYSIAKWRHLRLSQAVLLAPLCAVYLFARFLSFFAPRNMISHLRNADKGAKYRKDEVVGQPPL